MWRLGLSYSRFEVQQQPLGDLRRLRNKIAHGEDASVSDEEYAEQARRAVEFIDTLEDEIVGSIREERYLREAAESP